MFVIDLDKGTRMLTVNEIGKKQKSQGETLISRPSNKYFDLNELRMNDELMNKTERKVTKILSFEYTSESYDSGIDNDSENVSRYSDAELGKIDNGYESSRPSTSLKNLRKKSCIFDHPSDEVIRKQA